MNLKIILSSLYIQLFCQVYDTEKWLLQTNKNVYVQ